MKVARRLMDMDGRTATARVGRAKAGRRIWLAGPAALRAEEASRATVRKGREWDAWLWAAADGWHISTTHGALRGHGVGSLAPRATDKEDEREREQWWKGSSRQGELRWHYLSRRSPDGERRAYQGKESGR
ncbi:hypothetical protein NL676_031843 [Syzygium grande]|nr:hypothetical protein NL676_031843 [Syzygium grande]